MIFFDVVRMLSSATYTRSKPFTILLLSSYLHVVVESLYIVLLLLLLFFHAKKRNEGKGEEQAARINVLIGIKTTHYV
jgi:hypothetical protein